jgi:hypothetical protein
MHLRIARREHGRRHGIEERLLGRPALKGRLDGPDDEVGRELDPTDKA